MEPAFLSQHLYAPLRPGQTRYLRLLPNSDTGPVRLELSQSSINSTKYVAISHRWGSLEQPKVVEVISPSGFVGMINVSPRLHAGLLRLRGSHVESLVWIDAICIDQHNLQEREQQVNIMRRIFRQAQETLVWLGEDADGSAVEAFECAAILNSRYRTLASQDVETANLTPWKLDEHHAAFISEPKWRAFERLLSNPWFSRVWVYQEVAVSEQLTLICGRHRILWEAIAGACESIEAVGLAIALRDSQPLHTSVLIMSDLRQKIEQGTVPEGAYAPLDSTMARHPAVSWWATYPRMHMNLLLLRWAAATDPRDKVYALLGISSGTFHRFLHPDYTISVGEAYMRTARELCCDSEHDSRDLNRDFASWVPDWRGRLLTPWLIYNSGFRATGPRNRESASVISDSSRSKRRTPRARFPENQQSLEVMGVRLMQITLLSSQGNHIERLPTPQLLGRLPNPYTPCSWEEAFAEGIAPSGSFLGCLEPPVGCHLASAAGESFWDWKVKVENESLGPFGASDLDGVCRDDFEIMGLSSPQEAAGTPDWDQLGQISGIACGRRFFMTDLGFLGFAPFAAKVGDEIWALQGGTVLYVLRLDGHAGLSRRFVGECYVYGLMNGEVMRGVGGRFREVRIQ